MEDRLKKIARKYARKVAKQQEKVIEKAFTDGWRDCNKTYCEYCELYNTEFRCEDCKK